MTTTPFHPFRVNAGRHLFEQDGNTFTIDASALDLPEGKVPDEVMVVGGAVRTLYMRAYATAGQGWTYHKVSNDLAPHSLRILDK